MHWNGLCSMLSGNNWRFNAHQAGRLGIPGIVWPHIILRLSIILSLSKDAGSGSRWFDKLTMKWEKMPCLFDGGYPRDGFQVLSWRVVLSSWWHDGGWQPQ